MRACLLLMWLLATSALFVQSKPHGKHRSLHGNKHDGKEAVKTVISEEIHHTHILPTLVTFEASSQGQEEEEQEETTSEDNLNAKLDEDRVTKHNEKASAVLLSEEELATLLKKDVDEEGDEGMPEEEEEVDRQVETDVAVEATEAKEDLKKGEHRERQREHKEEGTRVGQMEELDGSAATEIPVDLDYAADSSVLLPLRFVSPERPPLTETKKKVDVKELPSTAGEVASSAKATEAELQAESQAALRKADTQEPQSDEGLKVPPPEEGAERETEEQDKNESASRSKGKVRKEKKSQRMRKHSPQRDEAQAEEEQSRGEAQEPEGPSEDNVLQKAKRRRAGKWGPTVGMNPVQIRGTVDLYPGSRPPVGGGIHPHEAADDPCDNFRCKRGKTCKVDADKKPSCVCQEPSECPPSMNEFDHVCGTDNTTYDTSCELFATKCQLEGTKRGHKLHLDYTGTCKLIAPCLDSELVQFPLRMRDWLKNVLLQLYEHDSMSPGFLTAKQRFRVKKMYESERRLHAGDHSVELLAHDFEKNYNMYIYPVHWQFAQLDQHPSDRALSHSELAPLRVPLVPMEHCTSRFFQECDADKDKQISFTEWASCFGIKTDDMDVNLLF